MAECCPKCAEREESSHSGRIDGVGSYDANAAPVEDQTDREQREKRKRPSDLEDHVDRKDLRYQPSRGQSRFSWDLSGSWDFTASPQFCCREKHVKPFFFSREG